MGRGVKRVVEAEKGRERESEEIEASHEHAESWGQEWGRGCLSGTPEGPDT